MAYIGQGIKQGTFKVLDTSGNTYNGSNTTFNLGTQVGSAAQLLVSHDGVIQKAGTDYTLATGGTQITFSTAPASGASIFITEISGAVGGTVTPSDTSVTADKLNTALLTGHTDIGAGIADADLFLVDDGAGGTLRKTAASRIKTYVGGFDVSSITGATEMAEVPAGTDEFNISDGGTLKRIDFAHMNNTPAFCIRLNSDQSINSGSATKITFDVEEVDTDSAYDPSTNNRFTVPSGKGGLYHLVTGTRVPYLDDQEKVILRFYINGSEAARGQTIDFYRNPSNTENVRFTASATFLLTENDYVEVYVEHNEGSAQSIDGGNSATQSNTFFGGYRISGSVPGTS